METSEETDQTEEKGQSDFENFANQALRGHRKGSFETLLAQHLVTATPSEPLSKIRLVCEACWMAEDKLTLDMNQIETIYQVTLAFIGATKAVCIAWGFDLTEESFQRFVKPWHKGVPLSYTSSCESERNSCNEILEQAKSEAERFWLFTTNFGLTTGAFVMLKAEFLRWSIPIVMRTFATISRLVDPDLAKELLTIMQPK